MTLFETIHSGTPIVTLKRRFLRSRIVSAAYQQMGVSRAPIAHTFEEYVALATGLIHEPKAREALRKEIQEKALANLYDRLEFVRGFENFVLERVRGSREERTACDA